MSRRECRACGNDMHIKKGNWVCYHCGYLEWVGGKATYGGGGKTEASNEWPTGRINKGWEDYKKRWGLWQD